MDRYEADQRVTIDELISSAESGVEVELTRNGKVVARVVSAPDPIATPAPVTSQGDWLADLQTFHANLPPDFPRTGWQQTLRDARDEDPF